MLVLLADKALHLDGDASVNKPRLGPKHNCPFVLSLHNPRDCQTEVLQFVEEKG